MNAETYTEYLNRIARRNLIGRFQLLGLALVVVAFIALTVALQSIVLAILSPFVVGAALIAAIYLVVRY